MATSDVKLKIDSVLEKPYQRLKRMERYEFYRKSAYPPMSLEPLPEERSRLAGEGMTPEQRALRKQWVHDQVLHHEKRFVPELQPYNIFRRIYRFPADVLIYKPLNRYFGPGVADACRYSIPKIVMAFLGSYLVWYHLKYNANDWTRQGGIFIYQGKPSLFGNETHVAKEKTEYFDQGFRSRKALL